jgi:hypothetical protein
MSRLDALRTPTLSFLVFGLILGSGALPVSGAPADSNCDGWCDFDDIDPFVLALAGEAAYHTQYPACDWLNADCNGDGTVDFEDIDPFVGILTSGLPYLGTYSHSDCLDSGQGGWCPDDTITLIVDGQNLHVLHENAEYNCCPDDIVITFSAQGDVLRFDEQEILSDPCYCVCCYETAATVVGLASGTYTVEFCWYDYAYGPRCETQLVIIP